MPELPKDPSPTEEEEYYRAFSARAQDLADAGGRHIKEIKARIRETMRCTEKTQVSPTQLFHFIPGQLVMRRHQNFSKLDPRASGPYTVLKVSGTYRQKVLLEPPRGE